MTHVKITSEQLSTSVFLEKSVFSVGKVDILESWGKDYGAMICFLFFYLLIFCLYSTHGRASFLSSVLCFLNTFFSKVPYFLVPFWDFLILALLFPFCVTDCSWGHVFCFCFYYLSYSVLILLRFVSSVCSTWSLVIHKFHEAVELPGH